MSTDEGQYGSIDVGTTDFYSLLSALSTIETTARKYRSNFRMPRLIFPTILVDENGQMSRFESATVRNLRVSLYQSANEAIVSNYNAVDDNAQHNALSVDAFGQNFNGSTWDRARVPTAVSNASAAGATSTSLVAAVAAKKYRVWGMALSSVATAAATDGVVSINEATSGVVLLSLRVSATSAAVSNISISIPGGIPQTTANNAIQVTSIANITTDATLIYGTAE